LSITYVDRDNNIELAAAEPSLMLIGESPHVIDEWQRVPSIWDTVRHAVDDARGKKGLWILTGSSTPPKDKAAHSGAGRIGRIRMLPLSLSESGDSTGEVSLKGLFSGTFTPCRVASDIAHISQLVCRGGWPELVSNNAEDAQVVIRAYLDGIYEQSIPQIGKSADTARRLAASLARNLGQAARLQTLNKDTLGENGVAASEKTVSSYLEAFTNLFLVDTLKGWAPPARSPQRVQLKEKRYFADPSMAVATLGMSPESLLNDWQTFGLVFENLCMRDIQVYARALPDVASHPVRYYRDDSGLEVDAIVELVDGSWGAFEIKVSEAKVQDGVDALIRLKTKLERNPKTKMKAPSFLCVIVGAAEYARRTPEGVYVVPIRALGA
jgi:predicted AAA+ superfamily ATPase